MMSIEYEAKILHINNTGLNRLARRKPAVTNFAATYSTRFQRRQINGYAYGQTAAARRSHAKKS